LIKINNLKDHRQWLGQQTRIFKQDVQEVSMTRDMPAEMFEAGVMIMLWSLLITLVFGRL